MELSMVHIVVHCVIYGIVNRAIYGVINEEKFRENAKDN